MLKSCCEYVSNRVLHVHAWTMRTCTALGECVPRFVRYDSQMNTHVPFFKNNLQCSSGL